MLYDILLKYLNYRIKRSLKNIDFDRPLQLINEYQRDFGSNVQKIHKLTSEIIGPHGDSEKGDYISTAEYRSFKKRIEEKSNVFANKPFQLGALDLEIDIIVSLLSQLRSPKVLEVGVANGYSSAFVYHALTKNNGSLTSIDLPRFFSRSNHPYQMLLAWLAKRGKIKTTGTLVDLIPGGVIPEDRYAGWLVPIEYRLSVHNITIIGNAFSIIDELDAADYDFVLIDAMKDYSGRLKMLNMAINKMNSGAICVMDGYWVNSAFDHFCSTNNLTSWKLGRVGIFRCN